MRVILPHHYSSKGSITGRLKWEDCLGVQEPTEWITDVLSQMVDWDGDNELPWHLDLLQFFLGNYLLSDFPFLPAVARPSLKKEAHCMADMQAHVCIARGFEELYRRFASTPQSTLSLQVLYSAPIPRCLSCSLPSSLLVHLSPSLPQPLCPQKTLGFPHF
jgi:hypothetical protein